MDEMKKDIIVISGINIRKGGTLNIFYEFLNEIVDKEFYKKYDIRILVSDEELFKNYRDKVKVIDFKDEKESRFKRYYYEYFWMKKYSKKNDVFLWLSINDKTPSVKAKYRAVYCHNNTMFCKIRLRDIKKYRKMLVYSLFYPLLWKKNIKDNDMVVVQQHWLAEAFEKNLGIKKICVMRPHSIIRNREVIVDDKIEKKDKCIFIYPTKCSVYKNIDLICEASSLIKESYKGEYKIIITINENDSKYAHSLIKKYSNDEHLLFCGFLSKEELFKIYNVATCLVFPSRQETWGLPMTEFAAYNKNIIASDLPYAHENLREYEKKAFVDPDSPRDLAELMKQVINGVEFKYEKKEDLTDNHLEIDCFADIIDMASRKQ